MAACNSSGYFIAAVRERARGAEVHQALNPAQQIIKIVHEELVRILGEQSAPLELGSRSPAVLMLAGLQGSGKTTALVDRMVAVVLTDAAPVDRIAAVTFTRKAAAELQLSLLPNGKLDIELPVRVRIDEYLHGQHQELLQQQLPPLRLRGRRGTAAGGA